MRTRGLAFSVGALALVVGCSGGGGATNRPTVPAAASLAIPSGVCLAARRLGGQRRRTAAVRSVDRKRLGDRQPESGDLSANDQLGRSHDAYCVYNGKSGATGGLEFDAFVDQSATGATDTFNTMAGDCQAGSVDLPGVDAAQLDPDVDGRYGGHRCAAVASATRSHCHDSRAQTTARAQASLVLTRAQQYK